MSNCRFFFASLPLSLLVLGAIQNSHAQITVTGSVSPVAAPTLKEVFDAVAVSDGSVLITLSADKAHLPPNTGLGTKPFVSQVAAAFNLKLRKFGHVTALAPQNMVIINAKRDKPNIYEDLPSTQAFRLLLTSLNETQWNLLVSSGGLPFRSMTSDSQRQLFVASIPSKKILVTKIDEQIPFDVQKMPGHSEEIAQSSLRLGQRLRIFLPQNATSRGYISTLVPGK